MKNFYKRILLKLSGEAFLKEENTFGVDSERCHELASSLLELNAAGVRIGVVLGGGNIFRGKQIQGVLHNPITSDRIGMVSTLINGLWLQEIIQLLGGKCAILSAFSCGEMVEPFSVERALQYLEEETIVLLVGGTGQPFFTTDTAAVLRALELKAEIVLKGTKVEGIFDRDPVQFSDAKKWEQMSFSEILAKNLQVMDPMAAALCRTHHLPMCVFNIFSPGALKRVVCKEKIGTLVSE